MKERSNQSSPIYSILGIFVFCAATFVFGYSAGKEGINLPFVKADESPVEYRLVGEVADGGRIEDLDFNVFWQVWDTLETHYIEQNLNEKDMLDGAIKGLVGSLGDYATAYYSNEDTAEYNKVSAGNFEGIGAELGYENGQIIVKAPMRDYPAQKAGLRAMDKILKINGEDTYGLDIVEAVLRIRGESGTDVALTILSEDEVEARDVVITRETIHVPSVEWEMYGNVALIDIRRFTEDSLPAWMATWDGVVDNVVSANPEGVIIDLRGNPGGYFDAAVWAASDFLSKDSVISLQQDREGDKVEFKVSRKGKLLDVPLLVLIDEGSASASEILSGALKHYDKATVMGKATYGKGTAQNVMGLGGGASLHITTQKWLLPDESWINPDNKVIPDIEVEYPREDFEKGKDPQFEKALEFFQS